MLHKKKRKKEQKRADGRGRRARRRAGLVASGVHLGHHNQWALKDKDGFCPHRIITAEISAPSSLARPWVDLPCVSPRNQAQYKP
jgi:hypothetical protein